MARIAGVDLPRNKRIDIGLAYIYGIGRPVAMQDSGGTSISPATRVKDLTEAEAAVLREIVEKAVSRSRETCAARCSSTSSA